MAKLGARKVRAMNRGSRLSVMVTCLIIRTQRAAGFTPAVTAPTPRGLPPSRQSKSGREEGSGLPPLGLVLATLAGAYRLSKRPIQQLAGDLFGLSISTGMISKLERQSARALEIFGD